MKFHLNLSTHFIRVQFLHIWVRQQKSPAAFECPQGLSIHNLFSIGLILPKPSCAWR